MPPYPTCSLGTIPVANVLVLDLDVRTFSSSCITLAGEKKWVPMTREGSLSTAAISSMFSPLVLVQIRASGLVFFSMSRINLLLQVHNFWNRLNDHVHILEVGIVERRLQKAHVLLVLCPGSIGPSWPDHPRVPGPSSCRHPATPASHPSRQPETPFCTKHMAMPPPMSPAPRMPIFFSGAGFSLTPGTFCAMRSARKRCLRAADCTEKTCMQNPLPTAQTSELYVVLCCSNGSTCWND